MHFGYSDTHSVSGFGSVSGLGSFFQFSSDLIFGTRLYALAYSERPKPMFTFLLIDMKHIKVLVWFSLLLT